MTHVASTQASSLSSTSLNLTIPSASLVGDVAVVQFAMSDSNTATPPAGWSQVHTGLAGNLRFYVFSRTLGSGDANSTLTLQSTASAQKITASLIVVRGASLPPEQAPTPIADNTSGTNRAVSSVTITGQREVITGVLGRGNTSLTNWTAPAGFTNTAQSFTTGSGETSTAIGYASASAGAVGGGNWVSDAADSRAATWLLVLNTPATPLPNPTFTTVVTDPSPLSASNGTVEVTVTNHTADVDHYVIESAVGHNATSGFTTHSNTAGPTYTITGLPGGPRTVGVTAYPQD